MSDADAPKAKPAGSGPNASPDLTAALERRVVELEVQLSYQDKLIADLDKVVQEFTDRVEFLAKELETTREALVGMRETGPANDPPPHY